MHRLPFLCLLLLKRYNMKNFDAWDIALAACFAINVYGVFFAAAGPSIISLVFAIITGYFLWTRLF
jgi:hypothetical protein